ncbi:MAG: phosphatase PAP2-related protein [Bacteroidetes bacterium]|nr:phosphatase PAP2-related protein [Bacteroidota bacterium]
MTHELHRIPQAWSRAWDSKAFRNQFALSVLFFIGVSLHQFHFLRLWQLRPGIQVNDLILNFLPPHDFSMFIFFFEYSTMLMVFIFLLPLPERLIKGIQMFALILFARTATIYLFPLEPPRDMIFLNDPMATFFLHTKDIVVTKDLFFSGHVSALALLFLLTTDKWLKKYAAIAAVLVSSMIMCQHVHYSMDVLFGALVSYTAYKLVFYFHTQTKYGLELKDA